MFWYHKTRFELVETSPAQMARRYPAEGPFRDGSGNAAGSTDWLLEPTDAAVATLRSTPRKYWTFLDGDAAVITDDGQRATIDAAEADARNDAIADQVDSDAFNKALIEVLLDEINTLRGAVIPPLSERRLAQIKLMVRVKLDG